MDVYLLPDIVLQQRLTRWSKHLAKAACAIAVLALLGWQFDIDLFKRPLPGLTAMNPATALGLMLSAFAILLFLAQRPTKNKSFAATLIAVFVFLIGFARLLSIFWDIDIPVDTILYPNKLAADINADISNGMAPNAAAGFALTGISLLFFNTSSALKRRLSNGIAIAVALLALLSIIGYLYNVKAFYGIFSYVPMAFHTCIAFLCLALAILFGHPAEGVMKEFTTRLLGSVAARPMIIVVIAIPIVLGLLRLFGHWNNIFSVEFGVTILVTSIIVVFLYLVWYNAVLLNKRDALQRATEDSLRESEQKYKLSGEKFRGLLNSAPDAMVIADEQGKIVIVNHQTEKLFGYTREELINQPVEILIPADLKTGILHTVPVI